MIPIIHHAYLFPDYQPQPAQPQPLWSPAQHEALSQQQGLWQCTRDLFSPAEVGKLTFFRWLLATGRVGRG